MNIWHEVTVRYTKEFTDGTLKRVSEPYLVSAMSFTDAEAIAYKEVGEAVRGEFMVSKISKKNYEDIIVTEEEGRFYEAKIVYRSEDADSGKETKVAVNLLIQGENIKQVYEEADKWLEQMLYKRDYSIPSIKETKIEEIFLSETGQTEIDLTEEE